jgi:hypothetical protein
MHGVKHACQTKHFKVPKNLPTSIAKMSSSGQEKIMIFGQQMYEYR